MIKKFEDYNSKEITKEEKIQFILDNNKNMDGSLADYEDLKVLSDEQLDKFYLNVLKNTEGLNENDGSTSAVAGSGTAVGSGDSGSFVSAMGVSVGGGTSGSAFASNSGISGMGNIISSQPSSTPGDVAGSTKGSGDIGGRPFGIYTKSPVKKKRGKKKSKNPKRKNAINKIDNLYTTSYVQTGSGSKIIQNWKTFNESKELSIDDMKDSILQYVNSQDDGSSWDDNIFDNMSDENIIKEYERIYGNSNEEFNVFGNVSRLQRGSRPESKTKLTGRMDDDNYAYDLFEEMKKDFIKYNKDLNKVHIIENERVTYIFGKFDRVTNSSISGNTNRTPIFGNVLNKKVTIVYIKPELLLKKNSLEKMFGVSRGLKFAKGSISIEETIVNPKYNSNFKPEWNEKLSPNEKDMIRNHDRRNERFDITFDVAKEICGYFNDEYNKQYPQLKDAKYKTHFEINNINNGNKPNLGYVHVYDKNNNNIIYNYDDLKDKKKIETYIKNNIILKGKNKENYPITYFTLPNEDEKIVKDNMMNMSQKDINTQNMERVYSFKN